MASPTLSKVWQFNVNNVVSAQPELSFHQELVFAIKQALTSFATLPWTVVSSSDGVTAGAGDKWIDQDDLIWSTGNHSWIVLQQGAGGGQFCFDMDQSATSSEDAFYRWSPGGNFTGGTISARPTATDEIDISTQSGNQFAGNQSSNVRQNVWHAWHSTDGLVTRIVICRAGIAHTFWRFEAIDNPRAGHTNNPTVVGVTSKSSPADFTVGNISSTGTPMVVSEKDGTGTRYTFPSLGIVGRANSSLVSTEGLVLEEWDQDLFGVEEHFQCATVGARGPKGSAFDSWMGQENILTTGDCFPQNAAAREFVYFSPFIWPWLGDGTIPKVA